MNTATNSRRRRAQTISVIDSHDVAADAKSRISRRRAKKNSFHVKALSNGSHVLEPRVLVAPHTISTRTRKMLDAAAANLKKGVPSVPINLTRLLKA